MQESKPLKKKKRLIYSAVFVLMLLDYVIFLIEFLVNSFTFTLL